MHFIALAARGFCCLMGLKLAIQNAHYRGTYLHSLLHPLFRPSPCEHPSIARCGSLSHFDALHHFKHVSVPIRHLSAQLLRAGLLAALPLMSLILNDNAYNGQWESFIH